MEILTQLVYYAAEVSLLIATPSRIVLNQSMIMILLYYFSNASF